MSPLQEKILADVEQLDPVERLEVIARIVAGFQQKLMPSPNHKLSRKDLFGCLRGQIMMTEDFSDSLAPIAID